MRERFLNFLLLGCVDAKRADVRIFVSSYLRRPYLHSRFAHWSPRAHATASLAPGPRPRSNRRARKPFVVPPLRVVFLIRRRRARGVPRRLPRARVRPARGVPTPPRRHPPLPREATPPREVLRRPCPRRGVGDEPTRAAAERRRRAPRSDKNKSGGYPPRDAHGGSDDASRASAASTTATTAARNATSRFPPARRSEADTRRRRRDRGAREPQRQDVSRLDPAGGARAVEVQQRITGRRRRRGRR